MDREDTTVTIETGTESRPDTGYSKSSKTVISDGTLDVTTTEYEEDEEEQTEEHIESLVESQIDDQLESLKRNDNQSLEDETSTENNSQSRAEDEEFRVEASSTRVHSIGEIPATGQYLTIVGIIIAKTSQIVQYTCLLHVTRKYSTFFQIGRIQCQLAIDSTCFVSTNFNTLHSHLPSWSSSRALASCARGLRFNSQDRWGI